MTTENKILIGAGSFLAIVGGFIFYKKSQENKELPANDTAFLDSEYSEPKVPIVPKLATAPIKAQPSKPINTVIPDGFSYRIGQRIMANLRNGVPAQDVFKDANGQYFTKGNNIKRFDYGDEIGEIIWIGKRPDNTYRYVAKKSFGLFSQLYWVEHKDIKPIGVVKPPKATVRSTDGLDMNKLLHRGVYNSKEVKELQKRLKVTADGEFGQNTEKKLLAIKGVKQIKLKDY